MYVFFSHTSFFPLRLVHPFVVKFYFQVFKYYYYTSSSSQIRQRIHSLCGSATVTRWRPFFHPTRPAELHKSWNRDRWQQNFDGHGPWPWRVGTQPYCCLGETVSERNKEWVRPKSVLYSFSLCLSLPCLVPVQVPRRRTGEEQENCYLHTCTWQNRCATTEAHVSHPLNLCKGETPLNPTNDDWVWDFTTEFSVSEPYLSGSGASSKAY